MIPDQTFEGRKENLNQANKLAHLRRILQYSSRVAGGQRRVTRGFMNDVRAISTYAPYVDAMFIDRECADLLGEGRLRPARLFYDFCLDDHVPADHLLRRIDRFLDLDSVRSQLKPSTAPSAGSRPDPELMRMLIIGYCLGIRSERRLCEEVAPQSGLSLVLPPGPRWQRAGSLHLLAQPARPLPAQRHPAPPVRDRGRTMPP